MMLRTTHSAAAVERPLLKSAVCVGARPPNSKLTWNLSFDNIFYFGLSQKSTENNHTKKTLHHLQQNRKRKQKSSDQKQHERPKSYKDASRKNYSFISAHYYRYHQSSKVFVSLQEKKTFVHTELCLMSVQTSVLRKNELNCFLDLYLFFALFRIAVVSTC